MSDPAPLLVMDLGGVTCRWQPERRLAELSQLSGQPASAIDQAVFESGFDDAGERGRFTLEEFSATLLSLLGVAPTVASHDAVRACWAAAFEPDPAVLALIEAASGPVTLFTNNGPLLELALDRELAEVGRLFDQLAFSWRLGTTKPEPEAFARVGARLGVDPGRLLLVDDSVANVDAARQAGWRTHHHTTALDLQARLSDAALL